MPDIDNFQIEQLRQALLEEMYAGAFGGGFSAMLMDEDTIRRADSEELRAIAQRYGFR